MANLTDHIIYIDRNDVIAYAQTVEMDPLSLGAVRDVLGLRTVTGREHTPVSPDDTDEMDCYQLEMTSDVEKAQKRQKILDLDSGGHLYE